MGHYRENGYSAAVEGFLVVADRRIRLAKTNGRTIVVAEPCEFPPKTIGELRVTVDGQTDSRCVELPAGVHAGQTVVEYRVAAPF